MRYLFINSLAGGGSTGRLAAEKCRELQKEGHECVLAYGRGRTGCHDIKTCKIGTSIDYRLHGLATRLFDRNGFGSKAATRKFLKWVEQYKPDVIWLHNIHGYYINIEMLFDFLKKADIKVIWTLHDCWSFTGHCAYFTAVGCDKWKGRCCKCPQTHRYPASYLFDNSRQNYERKKKAFTGLKDMTLVVPSHWLENLVRQSFLREYPVQVVYNEVDKSIFKPTQGDFREKYGLQDKKIILGVANVWEERKGLKDFIELSKMLDDTYAIVLVGLTEKQIKKMPKQIKGLTRTDNAKELVTIYSAADVFVNPSMEETFGMTTEEARACGTETIVYRETACEEISQAAGGMAIAAGVDNLYKAVVAMLGTDAQSSTHREGGVSKGCLLVCIPRVSNVVNLARIYTTADIFVNPTYEDNYPTVNLEAQACGTKVITYNVGGCAETLYRI